MNAWRAVYAAALAAFVVAPLTFPFAAILEPATLHWTGDDIHRLSVLFGNTIALTAGTLGLALPIGTLLAAFLFRTSFLGRRLLLFVLALLLFVPLPVIVSSWQAYFGADGRQPWSFWRTEDWLWATGLGPAICVHAIAAIPWVAFIVGIGLRWVEPELEDEAALSSGPWRTMLLVTLPRARMSLLAAALFVTLQTANEISVTDMMLVRTLADEAYTQFALSDSGLSRILVLSLPLLILTWLAVLLVVARLERTLPPPSPPTRAQPMLALGHPILLLTIAVVIFIPLIEPLFGLRWKLGATGHPPTWSGDTAWHYLQNEGRLFAGDLAATLAIAGGTGAGVALVAMGACWLARDCAWFRWLLFSIVTWAWVMPGPVVGIGLHDLILSLPNGPWKQVLYYGPSPAPLIWAQGLRALPIAVIFLWPIVRRIPRELTDEARVHGAGALTVWLKLVLPMTWRGVGVTALASAALCLGEVAASTRVETPGWDSFMKLLFDRMHYGVGYNVAALCVLMLASLLAIGLIGVAGTSILRLAFRKS